MSTSDSAHELHAAADTGRTLVLCFDGTLAEYDADVSLSLHFTDCLQSQLSVEHKRRQALRSA